MAGQNSSVRKPVGSRPRHRAKRKIRRTGNHTAPSQVGKVAQKAGKAAPAVAVAGALAAAPQIRDSSPAKPAAAAQHVVRARLDAAAAAVRPASRTYAVRPGRTRAGMGTAAPLPGAYTVQPGDTLSSIAAHFYGSPSRWPSLWWVNRRSVIDPDVLAAGQNLTLRNWHPEAAWLTEAALAAAPAPPPAAAAPRRDPAADAAHVTYSDPASAAHDGDGDHDGDASDASSGTVPGSAATYSHPAPAPSAAQPATVSYSAAAGSFQQCVISHESGGNPSAVNPSSGAGGLYQFMPQTWASLGYSGSPQSASVATQNAAFQKLYAQSGASPWSSDGC